MNNKYNNCTKNTNGDNVIMKIQENIQEYITLVNHYTKQEIKDTTLKKQITNHLHTLEKEIDEELKQ